jgi:hypothetical protein
MTMSLEFYEITGLVELAYVANPQATIDALVCLRDDSLKRNLYIQAELIHHAAVQLTRGESLQRIVVDGSANAPAAPAESPPEPVQETVSVEQLSPEHARRGRKRRV